MSSNKVLIKKGEGRYLVEVSDTHAEILAISSCTDKKSIRNEVPSLAKFEKLANKLYGLNLRGYL